MSYMCYGTDCDGIEQLSFEPPIQRGAPIQLGPGSMESLSRSLGSSRDELTTPGGDKSLPSRKVGGRPGTPSWASCTECISKTPMLCLLTHAVHLGDDTFRRTIRGLAQSPPPGARISLSVLRSWLTVPCVTRLV